MPIFAFLFRYLVGWIIMTAAVAIVLAVSEAAHGFFSALLIRADGRSIPSVKLIAAAAMSPVTLPTGASSFVALIAPVLALAAILPVCVSVVFLNFLPMAGGGGDILQILHFMILSGVCATTAIYALGTEYAARGAARIAGEFIKLTIILTAAFVSFAMLFVSLGVEGNNFHLNVFMLSLQLRSSGIFGYAAIVIFVFLALSHLSYLEAGDSGVFFNELPLNEYNGLQRAMMQIWMSLNAFLTAMLVTHIFFPWTIFREMESTFLNPLWIKMLGFAFFWLTAVLVRTLGVMICRRIRTYIEKRMRAAAVASLTLLLIVSAMGMIYYETYSAVLEVN